MSSCKLIFCFIFLVAFEKLTAQIDLCSINLQLPVTTNSLNKLFGQFDTICAGDTITYKVINKDCPIFKNVNFSWIFEGADGPDSIFGNTVKITYSDTGFFNKWVFGSNTFNLDSSWVFRSENIVLPCPPTANFTSNKQKICSNECIQFTDKSTRLPNNWQWYFEGGSPATYIGKEPPPICYTDTGKYDVQLIVNSNYGTDTLLLTDYIEVIAGPELLLPINQNFLLKEGDSITLQACAIGNTYQWQPNTSVIYIDDTLLQIQPDETILYTNTISTSNGCSLTCSYTVKVQSGLLLPTAFSPNQDGLNDIFRILNTNITLHGFSIYNRWGQQIFYTNRLNEGWDGTYLNQAQPIEVYTWVVDYTITKTGKQKAAKGNVSLVR
jgi:gliding motility-associated-like protein